ncbi:MAG: PH domain-containing protein [Candidatus Woesearchaeota archaeon]
MRSTLKTPKRKTLLLFTASQVPIALLMAIFLQLPQISRLHRAMALITVMVEAVLIFEITGNIVQKVRVDDDAVTVRLVLERQRIRWEHVKGLRQVLVSPLGRNSLRAPVKLFLIKAEKVPKALADAEDWWVRKGALANGRSSLGDLVERYDSWVRSHLKGWHVLWEIRGLKPQDPSEDARSVYFSLDGREKVIVEDLKAFGKRKASQLEEVDDLTYPGFVKAKGGKYARDVGHVWDTLVS